MVNCQRVQHGKAVTLARKKFYFPFFQIFLEMQKNLQTHETQMSQVLSCKQFFLSANRLNRLCESITILVRQIKFDDT